MRNSFAQPEQVNYMNNFQREQGNSYRNLILMHTTLNGERYIQIFLGAQHVNNNTQHPQQKYEPQLKKGVEDLLTKYIGANEQRLRTNEMLLKN